ncbi:MAG: LamG-like jellyroll fold domain-containing protein, partial [Cyclobacteriaceae bacterium]
MNDQLSPTLELRSPHSVSQFSAVGLEHRQNAIPDPTTFNDMLDFKMFPKQRNFVKDMRKHSGSFLIKLFLSIILIVASQFTQAQTIGQSAVSRSYLDSSQGILNADNTNLSSYINYRVSSYQFYSSAAGRQITPVLVEDTGSSLIVRGIGATRTAANGVNNFSFSLVSGSDVIANSNYRLGWRNGPTSTAAQQGVVNWNSGGASYDLHQPGGSSSISVGGSYGIDAQSPFSRTYSINWTLATPVDSEPTSQAYSASATSGLNSSSLSWGRGNGTNVIVFAAQTTGGSPSISDGSSYFASSSFGSGSSAGAGWYCVYNSSGSNVTVTNLSQNTNYRFAVYEYNNTYGTYNYNQSVGSNLINTTTDTPPTVTSITVPGSSTGAFPITINFSENVTGFDITDLSVGNGNASNFQTLSSSQYTADIAPLADGTTTIDIGIGLFQDFAGNANTAAANQASVTVTAKLALNFNGSNENVTIARTAITEGLTYEAWIKTSTTAGDPSYAGAPGMAIIGDYNNDVGFSFGLTNGLLEMNHFTSSWQTVSGTNSVANGSWHHVAVSHDKASGDVVLYLDGSVEVTGNIPWSAVADYHSFNRIGSTYTSGTLDGQFFQGDMDEVRIWNKPLSLAHINYYMDNELTGNEVGLIACYNFEEGTGTDLINVEGTTALNGSLQNMDNTNWSGGNASIGAPLGTEPDFVMDFDGTTQYVEVADDDAFSFGDGTTDQKLSMEAWVNFDVVTLQTIVSKRASASEWHFVIGSSGNPSIILMDNSAGGYIEKESTGISFTPGEWYHLAFTYDGSGTGNGITIYVDGTDVGGNATIVGSYTAMENTTSPVQIGTVNGGATFPTNGRLDEVRIWSVERTAAQINAFKDVELNGGEPNLVGYWNFENAGGSTIPDLAITDGAQNGTMTNMDPANDYVLQSNVANAGAQDTTPPSPTIATSSATTDSPIAIDIDFGEVVVNFEEADLTVVNAIIHNFTNVDGQNYTADLYANAAGTVTADISAGVANDLTGNASLIASQFSISANSPNNALAFSASDYVSIPHDPLFDLADDFTVEFWFNHTTSGNVIIIEKGNNNAEWSIQQSSGLKIILNIGNSATSTNGTYNDGNWHHAVVIYRGANDASIYIDGVDDTDNVNVGTPNYATYDGDVNIGGRGTSNSYNGTLDEIRIWDDERTFGEIQSFQNSSLIGNEDGLIAYYRFDETSGLNLPDLSGNARDGTLNNMTGTEWTTSTAFVLSSPTNLVAYASSPTEITLKWTDNSISENNYLIERADDFGFTTNVTTVDATLLANATTYVHSAGTNTGYFYRVTPTNGSEDASSQSSVEFATTDAFPGSGMEFTALTDRVVISNPENFEENILTVEAWVNTTSTTDFSRVAACGDGGGQRWSLNVNGTSWGFPVGKAVATAQFSGGAAYAASITDVNDGQWHHIAATYNLTTTAVQIYVDGVLEGSGSSSGSSTTAAAHVTLGNFHAPWDQSLQGQLDEVKIWNNIKSDFSDRFSPVDLSMAQPNLIGYFPLDENGGTTTVDRSANNNDGTILGATFVTSGAGAIPIYNATAVTTSAFTANWEAIAGGADDLTIEWGTGGSFANNTVLSGGAQNGSSSVVSASLTAGTVYEYRIKATVGGNETAYSDPVSFMVQPGSALPFTGDDFVTVADNSLLEPSGDFTIEYWMNTNA